MVQGHDGTFHLWVTWKKMMSGCWRQAELNKIPWLVNFYGCLKKLSETWLTLIIETKPEILPNRGKAFFFFTSPVALPRTPAVAIFVSSSLSPRVDTDLWWWTLSTAIHQLITALNCISLIERGRLYLWNIQIPRWLHNLIPSKPPRSSYRCAEVTNSNLRTYPKHWVSKEVSKYPKPQLEMLIMINNSQ